MAAKSAGFKLLVGAEITPIDAPPVLLWCTDREAYGRLARLLTQGRRAAPKGECHLTLDDVAEADQPALARERRELRAHLGRGQVHPSHHAGDEGVALGQLQEPARLLQGLPRLHGHAGLEAGAAQLRLEIGGKEVAAQRGEGVVDPAVGGGVVAPEMLVGVDGHGCLLSQGGNATRHLDGCGLPP